MVEYKVYASVSKQENVATRRSRATNRVWPSSVPSRRFRFLSPCWGVDINRRKNGGAKAKDEKDTRPWYDFGRVTRPA